MLAKINISKNLKELEKKLLNKEVVVLCGGPSKESEVSLASGNEVYQALKSEGISVIKYEFGNNLIELWNFLVNIKEKVAVFNALHGNFGEDGTLVALLETLAIPYTHSGITTSALAMNKFLTKKVAASVGLLLAKDVLLNTSAAIELNTLAFPLVVKPNNEGSSIGVYIVNNKQELQDTIKLCKHNYQEVLLEEYLGGAEFSVGLINGIALEVTEIVPSKNNHFYNYEAKYQKGGSSHIIPAKINHNLREYMLTYAEKMYKIIGCKGIARVDFKEKDGKAYFLEINTHPGFTATSLLPEQAKHHNISFSNLCLLLLNDAFNK